MKDPVKRRYVRWGVTLFIVVAASILLAICLTRLSSFTRWLDGIYGAFAPIVFGIAIAYVLNPVAVLVERKLCGFLERRKVQPRTARRIGHVLGVVAAMLLALAFIFAVIMLIVPRLFESLRTIVANGKSYYATVEAWVSRVLEDNPEVREYADTILKKSYTVLENWIQNDLFNSMQSVVAKVTSGVFSVAKWVINFLVGMIVAVYLLAGKERYIAQIRKANAALWNRRIARRIVEIAQHANGVFGGFIRGKILDSMIVGLLCYLGVSILGIPYPVLVATIVGVTDVIPFFGPFIGAIPCGLLILLVSPVKCLYFVIFILVLQQIDGNIIAPRILGDTTGLSSFWVLVSITVFGGIFGFVGMVLGVPLFSVIYMLVKDLLEERLARKGLPVETDHYYQALTPPVTPHDESAGSED